MNYGDLILWTTAICVYELRRFDTMDYGDLALRKIVIWHEELRRSNTVNGKLALSNSDLTLSDTVLSKLPSFDSV